LNSIHSGIYMDALAPGGYYLSLTTLRACRHRPMFPIPRSSPASAAPVLDPALAASVFYHTRNGIMITALDGAILGVNQAFSTITGYAAADVLGHNPRLFKSDRQDAGFYTAMWDAIRRDGFWQGETWNRRKDGSHFAQSLALTAVLDEHGAPHHYIAVFSDITVQREQQARLEQRSSHDTLTGLPNRMLLQDRLAHAVVDGMHIGQTLAVAFLDLDGFKAVNDTHGHATGDQVLVHVANQLALTLRDSDMLARLGGDEFVAVLPDVRDRAALAPLMARILAACNAPLLHDGVALALSASVGVAFFDKDAAQPEAPDALLRRADQAMYAAKRAGGNCYRLAPPVTLLPI
jgi:diguanylate cyclase (GGDEF)-like protein/PAS domain S-box-containing protein